MSDESRKDDVLELTEGMTASSNGASPEEAGESAANVESAQTAAVTDSSDSSEDEEVLELGEHHIVEGDAHEEDPHVETVSSIPAPPASSSSEPPQRKSVDQIPMARISYYPPNAQQPSNPPKQAAQETGFAPGGRDEPFDLQEGHVVQEGNPIDNSGQEPVEHAFDFGTPAMVFDDAEPSNGTKPLVSPEEIAPRADNTEEQTVFNPVVPGTPSGGAGVEAQPEHAVPFNAPMGSEQSASSQEYVSFIDDVVPGSGAGSSDAPAVPKRPSTVDEVFGDAGSTSVIPKPPATESGAADDVPSAGSEAVEPQVNIVPEPQEEAPIASDPASAVPEWAAMATGSAMEGVGTSSVSSQEAADVELDIDITDEVEEVVEEHCESAKPPPPPGTGRPINSFFRNDKIDAANASLKLQAKTARRSRGKKREWWASIFDDEYLMLLPERTAYEQQKQIDFIQRYLGLPPGALLLDLACGNGRNSIGMAQRNYRIVGVDLSLSMLARAGDAAQDAGQKINFIHGDMRDLGFDKTFDGVFSLDTSFGYFDEPTNMKVLQGVYRALKPGGTFLLELANRDFVIKQQPNMVWFQMDNMVCMEETDFNYINNRLYISRQLIIGDNEKQSKHEFSLRLYSLHEIGQLLHQAGFAVVKVSGHRATPGAFFGPESAKLIIIAERRGE
ncbi:MAG: methyltransferase domain-containing protein [Deltaproteobacteria bacterium]|nr:methyltransferase domain-containing protein [Deltaproteobacteria bacterium]MBN2671523.1 methyltransferase domain-containing protein [Deltaproteobacteria bacterium]